MSAIHSGRADARFHVNESDCSEVLRHQLWITDFTYAATPMGFVHVGFGIDVFARYIVGWPPADPSRPTWFLMLWSTFCTFARSAKG